MVLKRVVRRALRGDASPERGGHRSQASTRADAARTPAPAPKNPAPAPRDPAPAPKNAPAKGSIAARLAGGLTEDPAAQVKATSGASSTDYQQVQVNHSEDGTPYWGALDNESSRAKANGQTLVIDQWECISCGTCVENTDAVFVLPDDAKAVPHQQEGDMGLIQDAIDACPVTCIHWTHEPNQFEQLNDGDGNAID